MNEKLLMMDHLNQGVELRWPVPPHTTTNFRKLEYRFRTHIHEGWTLWSDWIEVPIVIIEGENHGTKDN